MPEVKGDNGESYDPHNPNTLHSDFWEHNYGIVDREAVSESNDESLADELSGNEDSALSKDHGNDNTRGDFDVKQEDATAANE